MKKNKTHELLMIWITQTVALLFLFYVILNILISQFVSPLYFKSLTDEKSTIVAYLQAIRSLPQFQTELIHAVNTYGTWVKTEVYAQDIARQNTIEKLEEFNTKHPHQRDVLLSLAKLYKERGNIQRAQRYFQEAQAIDPEVTLE